MLSLALGGARNFGCQRRRRLALVASGVGGVWRWWRLALVASGVGGVEPRHALLQTE